MNGYLVGKCYYSKIATTKFFNLRLEPYALSIILHLFFGLQNWFKFKLGARWNYKTALWEGPARLCD